MQLRDHAYGAHSDLRIILGGSIDAISVGDDNSRGPKREGLSDEALARLARALIETGLVAKEGSAQESLGWRSIRNDIS